MPVSAAYFSAFSKTSCGMEIAVFITEGYNSGINLSRDINSGINQNRQPKVHLEEWG
jgi:hypothetical protein